MTAVAALYRYPVKGFSPEPMLSAAVEPGRPIASDRAYAIENGPSGFDPAAPAFQPKTKFLCLMKNSRLAALRTRLDHDTQVWSIEGEAGSVSADLATADGRTAIELFLSDYMGHEQRGPLKVLAAPGHSFSDVGKPYVSFINLATVNALDDVFGRKVDPMRFRGNIHVEGAAPWTEFDWVGRHAMLGDVPIRFVKRTQRCVATNVDPATAARDMEIPATLLRTFDHMDCGVYAEVEGSGIIEPGARLKLA